MHSACTLKSPAIVKVICAATLHHVMVPVCARTLGRVSKWCAHMCANVCVCVCSTNQWGGGEVAVGCTDDVNGLPLAKFSTSNFLVSEWGLCTLC